MATTAVVNMVAVECCWQGCGIVWLQPATFDAQRHRDHGWFYCPNGHRQWYSGKNEEEELREQLKQERECCIAVAERAETAEAQLEHERRRVLGYQGVLAREQNKARRRRDGRSREGVAVNGPAAADGSETEAS